MKIGMMLGFEDSIKTITTIAREAEGAGINSLSLSMREEVQLSPRRPLFTRPARRRSVPTLLMLMPASLG